MPDCMYTYYILKQNIYLCVYIYIYICIHSLRLSFAPITFLLVHVLWLLHRSSPHLCKVGAPKSAQVSQLPSPPPPSPSGPRFSLIFWICDVQFRMISHTKHSRHQIPGVLACRWFSTFLMFSFMRVPIQSIPATKSQGSSELIDFLNV